MSDWSNSPRARVFTTWGTVLYVDPATGQLRHGPIKTVPENAFLLAEGPFSKQDQRVWLAHFEDNTPCAIATTEAQRLSSTRVPRSDTLSLILNIVRLERGLVALETNGTFLCAQDDGQITLANKWCSTWETFLLSEDWAGADVRGRTDLDINWRFIRGFIVDPRLRAVARKGAKSKKVLIYGYTQWSHGRVYYDLCNQLHERGYIVDILDWRTNHASYIDEILPYYDLYMTALDGVHTLVTSYRAPYEKIIAVSHGELDTRMLLEHEGMDVFEKFASYGVVSEFLYSVSQTMGVPRVPMVAPLGVNFSEFYADVPDRLTTVGYASSMSLKTYGVELKRGDLVVAAAREAELNLKVADSTEHRCSFLDMPSFYRSVDAIVNSSISEAAQLPVMEAAAAGRLVIGTPVGHFPRRAYQGGGILAPVEAKAFKAFTTATLKYYKENPQAFIDKCRSIQEAAKQFDWQYMIDEWVELIESARTSDAPSPTPKPVADGTHSKLMHSLWRTVDPYARLQRAEGGVDLQGWGLSQHPLLIDSVARHRPKIVVEIGVWKGASTVALAKKMRDCEIDGAIIAVDTWLGSWDHWNDDNWFSELSFESGHARLFDKFIRNVLAEKLQDLVIPLPLDSSNAYNVLKSRNIVPDLIHIDGAHDYDSVVSDLTHWWSLLRAGGTLVADDYFDDGMWPEVRTAVDDFLSSVPHREFEFREGKCRVTKV